MGQSGNEAGKTIERRFNITGQQVEQFGGQMRRTGAIATAALTVPLVAGMRSAVKEAALLEGAMAKFDVVFGDQAKATKEWVNEFREGVPLARREIIQAAAGMQDLLVPMGVARDDAAGMTKEWMELAAALAAFNDVPVSQALEAIRGGIAGEAEALRRFGVDVRVSAVEQKALSMGLIETGEAMSDQVRQQALLAQAYDNSKDAVEGYEDQLGTTLMVEQELEASVKDLMAVYGQDLQPMYTSLVGSLTGFVRKLSEMDEAQRQNVVRAALWVAALGPGAAALGHMITILPKATSGIKKLTDAMKANPYVAVGVAIAAIAQHVWRANSRIARMNDLIEDALSFDTAKSGQAELEQTQRAIDGVTEKIKQAEQDFEAYGATHFEEKKRELEKERTQLRANQIQIEENIEAQQQSNEETDNAAKANEGLSKSNEELIQSYRSVKSSIQGVKNELQDDIADGQVKAFFDEMNKMPDLDMDVDFDMPNKLFPPGSLGDAQSQLAYLEESLRSATDDETINNLQSAIGSLNEDIANWGGGAEDAGNKGAMAIANMSGMLAQAALHGESLQDTLKGLLKQLAAKAFVVGVGALLTGGASLGGGSFLSALFGGFRAKGGAVSGGTSYVVGEKGPELFTPSGSGMIVPNHQLSGGGGSQKITLHNHMNMDGREVFRNQRELEYGRSR